MRFVNHILRMAVLFAAVLTVACGSDKKEAENVAKTFLQAYYVDLNFAKAQALCSDISKATVAEQGEMVALNPYAKEEVPDIVIKEMRIEPDNSSVATCIYTCNRVERRLPLRNFNGQWLVDLGNGTVEAGGNSNFMQLSQEGGNGFASAASGEITYKKRRQGNNQ